MGIKCLLLRINRIFRKDKQIIKILKQSFPLLGSMIFAFALIGRLTIAAAVNPVQR